MNETSYETPLIQLEIEIEKVKALVATQPNQYRTHLETLEQQAKKLRKEALFSLSAYDVVKRSRHPNRPNTREYIEYMTSSFVELQGDRNYADDKAIVGGLAKMDNQSVMVIGHQKGRDTAENITYNFGMPKPEGYRKAKRLMDMANRFKLPIVTLIDTPGAYPGVGAEKRGQSEAIGHNLLQMASYHVPIICVVIGEGGSGGALALGVGNSVHMMQYATYSVISSEGCASILLKDAKKAAKMADALCLTAVDAYSNKIIDSIIPEPKGGAHCHPKKAAWLVKSVIMSEIKRLSLYSGEELKKHRLEKFLKIGCYDEANRKH